MRGRSVLFALAALVPVAAAHAAALTLTKSSTVVSDQLNLLIPRALPGSVVDYSILVTNPLANLLTPVRGEVIADAVPDKMVLRVVDYGAAGSGPVEFADGNLLNLGLTGSGLALKFTNLSSTTDGVEFFDGASWSYAPTPDANGYDVRVRAIRVTLTGTHVAGGSYRLRFRTRIK